MQMKFTIFLLLAALYIASAKVIDVVLVPKCPQHEEWDLCGRLCEPNCEVPKPIPQFCPAIECTAFTADCKCESGYVRDVNGSGKCIKSKDCSSV